MSWLRKLLGLCIHKWAIEKEAPMVYPGESGARYTRYYLRCEYCGDMKVMNGV